MGKKCCLVFGGNGCLGFEFLQQLLKRDCMEEFDVTLVNRGRSWDWGKLPLLPFIPRRIICDRKKPLSKNTALVEFMNSVDFFSFVVDFSGYHQFAVNEAIKLLKDKIGVYIYISSDSVYEVCEVGASLKPTKEDQAVRPSDGAKRKQLKHCDKYGHRKLKCEEALVKQHAACGFSYLILRLPDVIGPRDATDRWLQYQLWLKLSEALGIDVAIPAQLQQKPISLVFSYDVAKLIVELVTDNDKLCPLMLNNAFNLGFAVDSSLTVERLLTIMADKMLLKKVNIVHLDSRDIPQIYPSVDRGPIDISKAQSILPWNPTDFEQALSDTISFYESAMCCEVYGDELWEAAESLLEDLAILHNKETINCIKEQLKKWILSRVHKAS